MAERTPPTIEIDNVTICHRSVAALSNVTCTLGSGVIGLIGPNGAGKTTLMSAIAGLRAPDSGRCRVHGISMHARRARRKVLSAIGYLPQVFDVAPRLSVDDVVAYAGWCNGIRSRDLPAAVDAALAAVELSAMRRQRAGTLSGGERQRLGLAAATVHQPSILILDEPTVGLDPEQRLLFRTQLQATADRGLVLLSTHLLEDIQHTADRVLVLHHGRMVFDGAVDELAAEGGDDPGASALERGYLARLKGTPT